VRIVPRLKSDLLVLTKLFELDTPPDRLIRGFSIDVARYGFGDTSKAGFGASWQEKNGISHRFGTWGKDVAAASSNFCELKNLVDTLRLMAKRGELNGLEIFIFTNNSTAEAAFFNGSSKLRKLFELILELRELEMKEGTKIYFVHISSTRMIAQGSDGLSRGILTEGVMKGASMEDFTPLNVTALERYEPLKKWIMSWARKEVDWLSPEDWFVRGHDLRDGEFEENSDGLKLPILRKGTCIWTPPPAAACVALEELRKARHKRTESIV